MDNICYIICALDPGNVHIEKQPGDLVIAADKGYLRARELGVAPDVILGDFDSLGHVPPDEGILVFPTEKDYTDLDLALREGTARGYDRFCILGAMGGRPDQTAANYQLLASLADRGARGVLAGDAWSACVIKNASVELPSRASGLVSLFALGGNAEGVCVEGLKYALSDAVLSPLFPLGVSNEFCGNKARIEVKKGLLLVLWQHAPDDILKILRQPK